MSKPLIAIVGRPNVGKSTLFNKLTGQRLSIVEDTPGVTRDRIYAPGEWCGKEFMLVDTGGIEPKADDVLLSKMRMQAQIAIDAADVIIFVVDLKSGVTANDADIAHMLQKCGKPVVLCVNKCDSLGDVPPDFYEFYNSLILHRNRIHSRGITHGFKIQDTSLSNFKRGTGGCKGERTDFRIAIIDELAVRVGCF